jgi:putative endonuclease
MHYVYILENDRGGYYIGSTRDIEIRVRRHNQSSVRSTKNKGPFRLIYKEGFNNITEARKYENQLKSYKNLNYLKVMLKNKKSPSSSLV